ncbi:MAG: zinc metalloprotease HtpX [Candidatus Nezhaarchaeota archaeon]|nr:zinc metalloprotease HtpX [Candidatus Nezhaarchaeota archaeon]
MGLWKLRLSMIGTLATLIGLSTLFFAAILQFGGFVNIASLSGLATLVGLVVAFNAIQWLLAPYIIDSMYRAKEADRNRYGKLYAMLEDLCGKMRLKAPKLMIADIPVPNAFAYGSPLTGNRVAVTTGLLRELEDEEVEAVLGHELGHLKHRDVQVMMLASVLPAIFYIIGYSLMWRSVLGERAERNSGAIALVGLASIAIYWLLSLLVLHLSRLREYYADRRSATTVRDGARKLSEALAKIVHSAGRLRVHSGAQSFSAFKTLFIEDPDKAPSDTLLLSSYRGRSDEALVRSILSRRLTLADRMTELFSTHPNIVKRLRALQELR